MDIRWNLYPSIPCNELSGFFRVNNIGFFIVKTSLVVKAIVLGKSLNAQLFDKMNHSYYFFDLTILMDLL